MSYSKIINVIDIGTTKITTLVAQHFPKEEKINVIGVAAAPARGMRRGQIINIEEATASLVASIEAAERMAGTPIRRAIIGLAAPHIDSLESSGVVAVTEPDKEITGFDVERVLEAAKAVSLPATSEVLHVIPRQFIVDGQEGIIDPLHMTGVRLEVVASIVVASSAALKNLKKSLEETGIAAEQIIYSGFGAAEAVLTPTERELGVVLLDIGGTTTSITTFVEGAPNFVKVIPIGSVNVTNDLAIGLRLPLEEAEKIKIYLSNPANIIQGEDKEVDLAKMGIGNRPGRQVDTEVALNGIIKPRVEEICQLVRNTLREANLAGSTPAGLVITGGGSFLPNLEVIAQRVVGLPARLGKPYQLGGIADEITTPAHSTVLGLVGYSIKKSSSPSINRSPLKPNFNFFRDKNVKGIAEKALNILRPLLP